MDTESRIEKLKKELLACQRVKQMTETLGWLEVVKPALEMLIAKTGLSKVGDVYLPGKLLDKAESGAREWNSGYCRGVVEAYTIVSNCINSIETKGMKIDQLTTKLNEVPKDGGGY